MRAVVLSCSQRKTSDSGLLPAIQRYDGPYYRVIRRYLPTTTAPPLIWILSAEYGLITGEQPIALYDRRMTTDRAIQLRSEVLRRFRQLWPASGLTDLLINLSQDYEQAFASCLAEITEDVHVQRTRGGIGSRSGQLRQWLYSR
jgi:hypothetical protein